ncbi:polyprenyl synthetase family protein [Candidatus Pacearchaeota archaeon]|nr:polyprenyl synthetase family protein [Candidatus Pacearchaeota archaeon]
MEIKEILKQEVLEIDKLIEKSIPRNCKGWINKTLGNSKWEYDEKACNESITNPIWNLLDRGGKRWRPFLMKFSYFATGGKENINEFLSIPEIIHNGTLMIDDIEDSSDIRRGKECIHKIYGNDIAINAGNMMYYLPTLVLTKNNSLDLETKVKIYELINEEMVKLHFGQGMDIFWHKGNKIPNEKQYLQMCAFKTGTLSRMSAKLGAILAGATDSQIDALGNFAESIGIAFQIQDDILNITPSKNWGKDFGDDINEGKRTLLIIKALEKNSENDKDDLIGILNMQTKNKVLISEAIKIIKKSNAIEYSFNLAKKIVNDAWEKLESTLEESTAKNKLKLLSDFVINRDI